MRIYLRNAIFICFVHSRVIGTSVATAHVEAKAQVCALYIAPSIVDENELTLFSGIDYDALTAVGIDELVIPITSPNKNEHSPWHDSAWNSDILTKLTLASAASTSGDIKKDIKSIPAQYEMYSNFLISGLGSALIRCDKYNYGSEEYLQPNVQYSYSRRQYNLVGKTATSASISNIHNYGFVASKHGIRAGQEIVINCDMLSSNRDDEEVSADVEQMDYFVGRDLLWLQQNGICIDNFVVKESSISHKEPDRGAFAKRDMDVNTVISISPVVHMDRSQLDIVHQQLYDDRINDGKPKNPFRRDHGIEYNNTIVLGKQLLSNYVFGHPDSNMLMLPMAPGVNFINHYKVMDVDVPTGKHLKPNVGIRWSNHFAEDPEESTIKEFLEITPFMEWYDERVGTLVLEYYSLEPIKEGDELFLDYGIEWEKAFLEYLRSGTSTDKPFRHEIGVPTELYPRNWMRFDPTPDGDFIANPLEPNHLASIRWKNDANIVTPWAFRISLPSIVRSTLLKYCNEMGITDLLRHLTVEGNGPNPDAETYVNMPDNTEWFLQRTEAERNSNLHWFSPGDEKAHDHFLQALSVAGFDSTLKAIGENFGLDGLAVFHVTFIAVSWCTKGWQHDDFEQPGAKAFNVIIPLILANETGPELDLVSSTNVSNPKLTGRYRYEYNVASMLGGTAIHATSSCDYRTSKQFRLAATVYIADFNEQNVDGLVEVTTQAYPPDDKELFLSWAGRHWKPNDPTAQLPKPTADHILVRNNKLSGVASDFKTTVVDDVASLQANANDTTSVPEVGTSSNTSWTQTNINGHQKNEPQTSSLNFLSGEL